jgi:hypothetical protein
LIGLSVGGKLRMAVTVEAGGAEGWGRPEITAEVNTNHRFVQAPEVMPLDDRLKGYPQLAAEAKRACPDAVTEANTLDLKAEPPDDKKH